MVPETELPVEIRNSGHRPVDNAVASSALFISLCSLGIALHHGQTLQRLMEANSRPFIQTWQSNGQQSADNHITQALTVLVSNPGAGAARIEKFTILVDHKPFASMLVAIAMLAALPADARLDASSQALGPMTYSDIAPSYLKGGSEQTVLRWPRSASNADLSDKVSAGGSERVVFETCYCSIFDECRVKNSHTLRPSPTKSCA